MSDPLVSVIIPTYNREKEISAAVESVLKQTYQNIELIVVDDGSTDATLKKLSKYDDKIRVVCQDNAGPSAARNHGVSVSNGEIIAFLDSDDLYLPTKISRQVEVLQRVDGAVPCCLCNAIVCSPSGREKMSFDLAMLKSFYPEGIWKDITRVLITRFILFTQAVAIRREAFLKLGGFDEHLQIMEDFDLALRLSLAGPWAYIKTSLVIYHAYNLKSLSFQARKEKIKLQESIVWLYSKILSGNMIHSRRVRRELEHNIKIARRRLHLAQGCGGRALYALVLSNLMKLEQFKRMVYLRSPWFPQVENRSLDDYGGAK